jgi:hypothetical protein
MKHVMFVAAFVAAISATAATAQDDHANHGAAAADQIGSTRQLLDIAKEADTDRPERVAARKQR